MYYKKKRKSIESVVYGPRMCSNRYMYVCLGLVVQVSPKVGVVGVRRRTRKKSIFYVGGSILR